MSWEYGGCADILEVLGGCFDGLDNFTRGHASPTTPSKYVIWFLVVTVSYLMFVPFFTVLNLHLPLPLPPYRIVSCNIIKSTDELKIPKTVFK